MTVTLQDVQAAAAVIRGQVVETPCLPSRTLSEIVGTPLWIKFENLQFTASFKERGALNRMSRLEAEQRRRGVIAMSAGNHAQGVAYHAGRLGIPATIVMPEGTPFVKIEHTERHGARVVLAGASLAEAAAEARRRAEAGGLTLLPPYDDPDIIAGQGTVALEMLAAAPELEVLVVPVGGGGLISGMATAAKALAPAIQVVGVEVEAYPAMRCALASQPLQGSGDTIAEGIAVKEVGQLTVAICRRLVDDMLLVSEADVEGAVSLLATVEKTVAEGAGAAALAAVLAHPDRFAGRRTGIVLSGGNIDPRLLASVLMRQLVREGRIVALRIVIPDRPGVLGRIASCIGEAGGNIIEAVHQRLFTTTSVKTTDIDVTVECRSAAHAARVIAALQAAGFDVKNLGT
jgi:threonine dehydratase